MAGSSVHAASGDDTGRRAVQNASLLGIATIVARLAGFALAVVMGRKLGAAEYGRYGFANALSTVLLPLTDIGMSGYLGREVARARSTADAQLGTLLKAKTTLTIAMTAITAGAAVLLSSNSQTVAIVLLVLTAGFADGFSYFVFGYFRGRESMGLEGKLTAATSLARSAVGIVLVLVTGALIPVVVWMLLTSAAQLAIALRRLRRLTGSAAQITRAPGGAVRWRTVFSFGWFFLLTMIYTRSDAVLVGWLKDSRSVGLYTAAYTVMLGLQIIPFMVATALSPIFARTHDVSPSVFRSSWNEGIRAVLVVALPFSLLISLLGSQVMRDVFGTGFAAGGTALAIVVWCSPLVAFNTILAGALRGAGRDGWLTTTAVLGVVLNVGVNLWAIPAFGISAAATTTVATELLICGLLVGLGVRYSVVPLPSLAYARLGLSLAALAGVVVLARGLPLVAICALALLAYAAAIILTGVVRRSDLALLRRAISSR